MDDLVQFVRDCLDEEERVARDAEREMTPGGFSVESLCIHLPPEVQEHNARHNPARVLADVKAKRQILTAYEGWQARIDEGEDLSEFERGSMAGLYAALRILANIHRREEWRP